MKVLVDTAIWSLVLRRDSKQNRDYKTELSELIKEVRVQIIGPIRQEILSGLKSSRQFNELKKYLSYFIDIEINTRDYELAASYFNTCRSKGIQGSNTDFLICSVAVNNDLEIFTNDKDFQNFQKYVPIKLYSPRFIKGV
ncbi:MAG: PIN domain-containing protein [Candidatus Thorarchaeota archaeon]